MSNILLNEPITFGFGGMAIIKSQEVTRNHEIHADEDNWSAGSYKIGSCEQINCMKMF